MKILIKDLFELSEGHTRTDALVDIQLNRIAFVELTGGRNITFKIKLSEYELSQQLVEIVNKLYNMDLLALPENIYTRYMDA